MADITIPPEALEAAKNAWYASQHRGTDDRMTAACLAMLKHWPGMELDEAMWSGGTSFIVLPLTENQK